MVGVKTFISESRESTKLKNTLFRDVEVTSRRKG